MPTVRPNSPPNSSSTTSTLIAVPSRKTCPRRQSSPSIVGESTLIQPAAIDGDLFPSGGSATAPISSTPKDVAETATESVKSIPTSNLPTIIKVPPPVGAQPAASLLMSAPASGTSPVIANGYTSSPSVAVTSPRPISLPAASSSPAAAASSAAASAAATAAAAANLSTTRGPSSPKKLAFRLPPTRLELSLQAAHRRIEAADRRVSSASSDEDFQSAVVSLKDAVETLETIANYSERCMSVIRMIPTLSEDSPGVVSDANAALEADTNADQVNDRDVASAPELVSQQGSETGGPPPPTVPARERKRQRLYRPNLRSRLATSRHGVVQALSDAAAIAPSDSVLDPTAMKTG